MLLKHGNSKSVRRFIRKICTFSHRLCVCVFICCALSERGASVSRERLSEVEMEEDEEEDGAFQPAARKEIHNFANVSFSVYLLLLLGLGNSSSAVIYNKSRSIRLNCEGIYNDKIIFEDHFSRAFHHSNEYPHHNKTRL